MQYSTIPEDLSTNFCETKNSVTFPSYPYYGIYSRDPCEISKTLVRPRAPTFNKSAISQWKVQVTLSKKWEDNQINQDNAHNESTTPESPIISNRYSLSYRSCNHRIVSLF
ncbi:hypothetical protein M9Y10_043345 [Tritrichomonas musculus]|uniref:Uncharacterized protein n=1 Tax=Tritrichomonas musculus TaxID=1915356 RepID=A0ABR2K191_9EUKA